MSEIACNTFHEQNACVSGETETCYDLNCKTVRITQQCCYYDPLANRALGNWDARVTRFCFIGLKDRKLILAGKSQRMRISELRAKL